MVACALAVLVLAALNSCIPRADPQPQSWQDIIDRAEGLGLNCAWDGVEDSVGMVISDKPMSREEAIRLVATSDRQACTGRIKVYRVSGGHIEGADARWGRFDLAGDRSLIRKLMNNESQAPR
jgi:hypothetical protein